MGWPCKGQRLQEGQTEQNYEYRKFFTLVFFGTRMTLSSFLNHLTFTNDARLYLRLHFTLNIVILYMVEKSTAFDVFTYKQLDRFTFIGLTPSP